VPPISPALPACVLALLLSSSTAIAAGSGDAYELSASEHDLRSSYELVPLPGGRNIGIVGLHFDLHPFAAIPSVYLGVGGYGAAVGTEGGYFTMGGTLGNRIPLLDRFDLDLGLHVGAGGGSLRTFPGGGAFLRGHAMLEYRVVDNNYLRFGVAHTRYPNTTASNANDTHLVIGYRLSGFDWVSDKDGNADYPEFHGYSARLRIAPSVMYYSTDDSRPAGRLGNYTGDGTTNANFGLVGSQVDQFFSEHGYAALELYGAGGGGADGYGSVAAGLGARVPLTGRLNWEIKALLGVAGDARLDTGGGTIGRAATGLSLDLSKHFYLSAMAGRMQALDGRFASNLVDLAIGWQAQRPHANAGERASFPASRYELMHWRAALTQKTYFPPASIQNKSGQRYSAQLHLAGLEVSKPVIGQWLSGRASTQWAYAGSIGSYAEALLGVEVAPELLRFGAVRFSGAYDLGVGGGGNVALDEGYIQQAMLGVNFRLNPRYSLALQGGRMESFGGSFHSDLLQIQLVSHRSSLFAR
jgi:hypothetical protein